MPTTRRSFDLLSCIVAIGSIVLGLATATGFYLGMSNYFAGVLILASAPLFLILIIGLGFYGLCSQSTSRWRPAVSAIGIALGVLLLLLTANHSIFLMSRFHDLSRLPRGGSFTRTRFEYQYGPHTRIIHDPHNKLRFCLGQPPDEVTIDNGTRVIVFRSQKAVVKSWRDGVDVHPTSVQYAGWFGIRTEATELYVGEDGRLR